MELALFAAAMLAVGWASFWILGLLYGLIRRPAVFFPPLLALTMAVGAIVGVFFLGVGGVIAATWLMNLEFSKRADYNAVTCAIAGILISIAGSAATIFASYGLAWQIFE